MNECGRGRECAKCAFVTLEFPEIQSNGHTTIVCYLLQFSACLVLNKGHISLNTFQVVGFTWSGGQWWSMAIHPVLFWSLIHSLQHYREGVCLIVCPVQTRVHSRRQRTRSCCCVLVPLYQRRTNTELAT